MDTFIFVKPKRSVEDSFYYFVKNSTVKLISDSSAFGFVFRCHFTKKADKSPYFYLNSRGEVENVVHMALKCLLVNDRTTTMDDDNDHYWYYTKLGKERQSKRHFEKKHRFLEEVRIQVDVSKRGIAAMNRNAPVALFSKLFGDRSLKGKLFMKMLHRKCVTKECRHALHQMLVELSYRQNMQISSINYYLGILAMEYIDTRYVLYSDIVKPIIIDDILKRPGNEDLYKYDSLTLSAHSDRLRWIYNTARYDVLRMAVDTGYSQGDYHKDNMLLDEHSRKTILLDFGKAKKIGDHEALMRLWRNSTTAERKMSWTKQPSDLRLMLKIIYYATFKDHYKHDEFSWIKNIDEEDIDILAYLHSSRTVHLNMTNGISDIMDDFSTFNGICTVDNGSRIYAGSTLWSNILEYTIYGVFHTYFYCR